ncbi:MAG: putative hydrolase of the superfamily [Actinomycetota bacterium]|nr:putative hydrolase of the superfamily [Actinomycetota bacterium]
MTSRNGVRAASAPASPSFSVLLFDLDDTLFAHRRAVEAGVVAHMRSLGHSLQGDELAAEVERWNDLEEHHYSRYLTGELEYLGQRRERARDFMAPYGVTFPHDAAAEAWFEVYLRQYRAAWTLHDETLPLLDSLTGYRLGIITNGDLAFQMAKLDATGLTPYFEHIVTSGEFGIAKPDARIFRHAADVFGVTPERAMYVGDRLHTDAIGAARAGLAGVWLTRGIAAGAQLAEAAAEGAHVIRSLAELPALLAAHVSPGNA